MNQRIRRVQWLFPVAREVYRIARAETADCCVRCGSLVTPGRRGLTIFTRIRGTKWRDVARHVIHVRCIPTQLFETAGLPPRRLRAHA